jgi:hypothetical protein
LSAAFAAKGKPPLSRINRDNVFGNDIQSTMNSFAPVTLRERCGSAPSATW